MTEHEGDFAGIISDQARRLFEGCASREALAAADRGAFASDIWTQIETAGLPLALLAEEAGGIGLSPEAAFGIVRLAAYFGLPVPLGETMVVDLHFNLGLWHSGRESYTPIETQGRGVSIGV